MAKENVGGALFPEHGNLDLGAEACNFSNGGHYVSEAVVSSPESRVATGNHVVTKHVLGFSAVVAWGSCRFRRE